MSVFLWFRRDGASKVQVLVDTGLGNLKYPHVAFEYDTGSDLAAELLNLHLQQAFNKVIQAARAESYADGYRDAKAKRAKATWWSTLLERR